MILLNDYLSDKTNSRRILIVSDLHKGQALIRRYEADTARMVRNVTCMTLSQIADKLLLWMQAENGCEKVYTCLDANESTMLFRSLLLKNIKSLRYFNVEEMLDIATSKEIFAKANLARSNGWTGKETGKANDRIADLKYLISEYEQHLSANNMLDLVAIYKLVLSSLKEGPNAEEEIQLLFGAEISYLAEETDTWSVLEKELLLTIQGGKDHCVSFCGRELLNKELTRIKDTAELFKGYGSFNEAYYVANDILKRNLPFGNVTVLFSSASQIPAITAALRGNGIPMNILSAYPARDNAYVALAKRILKWAENDFEEKYLEAILRSSVIYIEANDETGEKRNALGGEKYFDYIISAQKRRENAFILGYGYRRNLEFIKHERALTVHEEALLDMHASLLHIFGEDESQYDEKYKIQPSDIYKKLVSFIEDYTLRSEEYGAGMGVLRSLTETINLEERFLSLDENIRFIEELLTESRISDQESNQAISVQNLGDWTVLERQYVYVIGLALKDMQGNNTQSPVMFDEEITEFLGDGYKPTIRNETERREKNLYRTIWTFQGKHIVFGYSSYDTVGFYDNNPSVFFRELMNLKGIGTKSLPEFVYGNPVSDTGSSDALIFKDQDEYTVRLKTSNSSMEVLLDCPKKYAYSKLLNIPEGSFVEKDFGQWLDAAARGNFFHELAEHYVKTKFIRPSSENYETEIDEGLLRHIAKEIETRYLLIYPAAFEKLADRETEDMIKDAAAYLQRLHDDYRNDSEHPGLFWRGLAAEQKFTDATYPVDGLDGTHYEFLFTGFIDRIDYLADPSVKKVYLRIIDYKTGHKKNKQKAQELGKLVQHAVYEKALMETGKVLSSDSEEMDLLAYVKSEVCSLEADKSMMSWEYEFAGFDYVFPMEKSDMSPIIIYPDSLENLNLDRLKAILTIIHDEKMYPDHRELCDLLNTLADRYPEDDSGLLELQEVMAPEKNGERKLSEDETSNCRYCPYNYLCKHEKAGDF